MSYIVSIRRKEGHYISDAELRALIDKDTSLHEVSLQDVKCEEASACVVEWLPEGGSKPVLFVLEAGEVSVTTPSDAALRKMQELARLLDASVIGEEGEDLTTVEVP